MFLDEAVNNFSKKLASIPVVLLAKLSQYSVDSKLFLKYHSVGVDSCVLVTFLYCRKEYFR